MSSPGTEAGSASGPASGAALLDLVAVMDRLRSPGGCPWDAEQTHASLVPYLLEETYEAVEALESGDRAHIVEELGDVLLQVVFHARIGQEDPVAPFGIDEVAAGIAAKLRRRHPHVFADGTADTPEAVSAAWAVIKAQERAAKAASAPAGASPPGPLDGIPAGMPSLARAAQVVARLDRAGRGDLVDTAAAGDSAGSRLLALVAEIVRERDDPDAALRAAVRHLTDAAR
jgi:XTP/dITP diphosphohydrolase